jgi:hypothetical protein
MSLPFVSQNFGLDVIVGLNSLNSLKQLERGYASGTAWCDSEEAQEVDRIWP